MIRRRLAAFALVLVTFAGCHEDPKVEQVLVAGSATALAIFTNGGGASTSTNTAGTGKKGGTITGVALGDLNLGGSTTIVAPTVPAAPTTGNTPLTSGTTGTPSSTTGTVIISGNITVNPATSPAIFQTTNGDIVVSGTLRTVAIGTQNDLTFSAPAGTVYVTGSIIASSSDGTPSGDFGGKVTVSAMRIVISGTIDTRGEADPVTGGDGGNVQLTSTGGPIIVTGSILTSGGAGTTGPTGSTGGKGGNIDLSAGTSLHVFGTLTTDGGAATDNTLNPVGGTAGNVTLVAASSVDVSSIINMRGGNATGAAQGATAMDGGAFSVTSPVPVKVYGTIDARGGTATATAVGTGLTGGLGGTLELGNVGNPLASLEMGRGTWSTIGGNGVIAVGDGGAIDLSTADGNIALGSDLDTRGGNALGTLDTTGGTGGAVTIVGDNTGGSTLSNHPLTANFFGSVTASGGAGTGPGTTGNGGQGGNVKFQSGGDITLPIVISTAGGTAVNGTGGQGGTIDVIVSSTVGAVGDVLLSGVLTSGGGLSTSGPGGSGGKVTVDTMAASPGEITSSADITTSGTQGLTGTAAGGTAGNVTFTTNLGNITLSGTITANGGNSINSPQNGAIVAATCGVNGGSISSSAAINVVGGRSLGTSATGVNGGAGGSVTFTILSTIGSIKLVTGSAIVADGGAGTGISGNAGGAGGIVTLVTEDQFVSISGTISATGGDESGGGQGGLGGQVVVNTDFLGAGIGGDITLNSNGSIDVSGGTGSGIGGGNARNNGLTAPDPSTAPLAIAVIFDADGGLGGNANSATAGVVRNLGTINARGRGTFGTGGDVWFDGISSLGGPLTSLDEGNQSRTGVALGDFSPN